jgi:hypothetical protein
VTDTEFCFGDAEAISVTCYNNDQELPAGSGPNAGQVPANKACIDLSPALARAIGIDGLGEVDWRWVEEDEPVA